MLDFAPRVLGVLRPCGARNADQADQMSLESCEDAARVNYMLLRLASMCHKCDTRN
ncbi:unnamed protein product [Prunus armeniaca]